MRVHRVYVPDLAEGERAVMGPEANHLVQVLRVSPGTRVRAFDGSGREAPGVVAGVEPPGRVVIELGPAQASEVEAALRITVAVALLKGDKLSDVVRQCTELGAAHFRLLTSKRADVPRISANKLDRLRRVAKEAAKQSGRSLVPEVAEPAPVDTLAWDGRALVAHPHAGATLQEGSDGLRTEVTLITGPEGGFSDDEVSALQGRGALAVRLGARVLRAETAPVAMLSALLIPEAL